MKLKSYIIGLAGLSLLLTACHGLDLTPLSSGSTGNWYSSTDELKMSLNDLYRPVFWPQVTGTNPDASDDMNNRNNLTEFENATITSQNYFIKNYWLNSYKMIARANGILNNYQRALDNGGNKALVEQYAGEAHFFRGVAYGRLVFRFGDVPYVTDQIDIEQGLQKGRDPKAEILKHVYNDLDSAAAVLPTSYSGIQRVTKGCALAYKARIALYMGDYQIAAEAAKAVMDLGVYQLAPDYEKLFQEQTQTSPEFIFILPRSVSLKLNTMETRSQTPRNAGGWAYNTNPSWDLLAAYTCTDGLPIDESPLFDSHNPFKNRDPRCSMTIQPFGEPLLGYIYDPSPEATEVLNVTTGQMVYNNDTRINKQYASFDALVWRKYVSDSWLTNPSFMAQNPEILMRYADVLLMYAEAKIELNQIDQSVIDAMNSVRARAYGVDKGQTDLYPAFKIASQSELRHQLRVERRMEFAEEHLRYNDIIRWKIAGSVMSRKNYGPLYPATDALEKVVKTGNWFWPFAPDIDENGNADFTKMEATGMIMSLSQRVWDDRQYLWPIPETEIEINANMTQNPGY